MEEDQDQMLSEAYIAMAQYYQDISDHNDKLIKSFGVTAEKHFKRLLEHADVTEKITFVDQPKGNKNNERYAMFKDIHVQEQSVGMEGDSYEGYIYANVYGKWIKIPYSC